MKGSLIVIVFFCVGCIMGVFNKFQFDTHTVFHVHTIRIDAASRNQYRF